MINLPPLAQTLVIAALLIGYFATFLFQKNQIKILKETNTSLKDLTDGQKTHIETYKEMVSLDEIKEHYELKFQTVREKANAEIKKIMQNEDAEKERLIKKSIDATMEWLRDKEVNPLFDKLKEAYRFIFLFLLDDTLSFDNRFEKDERRKLIQEYFPLSEGTLSNLVSMHLKSIETGTAPTL